MNSLEQQFLQLVNIVCDLQSRVIALENGNSKLNTTTELVKATIEAQREILDQLTFVQLDLEHTHENMYFEMNDPRLNNNKFFYPIIESSEATIDEIVNNGKSLARFGDGEFSTIAGVVRHRFQSVVDEHLAQRLKEVLNCDDERFVIGLADHYGNLDEYTLEAQFSIRMYLTSEIRSQHLKLLNPTKKYYNAYVTRPYVLYADNETSAPALRFQNLKRIWDGKDCVFVEGCYTGLGVGNDLFDNTKSIKRILGPAENAFSHYEQILDECLQQNKDALFLIALGPTATVLAYDLFKSGYQSVDIGHVDMEYEWFLKGERKRTHIAGKYNNEWKEESPLQPIKDETYLKQVIARIGTEE